MTINTFEEARSFLRRKHTFDTKEEITDALDATDLLVDHGTDEDRALVRAWSAKNSYVFNFDRKGNWIGKTSNEDGWTP